MKKLLIFFTICFFAACSSPNKIPDDVIGIDSMKLIIWDLTRAGKLAQIQYENNTGVYKRVNPSLKHYIPLKPNRQFKDSIHKKDSTHLTDSFHSKKDTTSLKMLATQTFQQVFDLYHITKEKFYHSYKYYEEHPDKNTILMDSLSAYAVRKRGDLYMKLQ